MADVPEVTSVQGVNAVKLYSMDDQDLRLRSVYYVLSLLQRPRYQCLFSDRRMPSCLKWQPERHEAHEYPHRRADIYRHHREPRIRPNQRSNKGTETEVCRSLASAQAAVRAREALRSDRIHYCVEKIGKQAAHAVESKIRRARLCSGIAEQEGPGYDG